MSVDGDTAGDEIDYAGPLRFSLEVWKAKFADLTAIRDRMLSCGKNKLTLIESKYKAASALMKEFSTLQETIIQCNLNADKPQDCSKHWTASQNLFEVLEVTYTEALDAYRAGQAARGGANCEADKYNTSKTPKSGKVKHAVLTRAQFNGYQLSHMRNWQDKFY